MKHLILLIFICVSHALFVKSQGKSSYLTNPKELGKVNWYRDYDEAISESKRKCLPVFILFQEVPGCANCTSFGMNIMSHPLIVEAIETYFIPLCIYNNNNGKDKVVLTKFNEPSWNNPVIRIIDAHGEDIVERQSDFRKMSTTIQTIKNAFNKLGQKFPTYLQILHEEYTAIDNLQTEEVFFSMFCFWSGEKEIAKLNGVIATEAGYMNGREVVKILFNKKETGVNTLFKGASQVNCGEQIYGSINKAAENTILPKGHYRKDKEDKYFLSQSEYRFIPMSELQKSKVNSAIGSRMNPNIYLSPRQIGFLSKNNKSIIMVDKDITANWW